MDCSLRGSSVHGIFQARVLEWIAIPMDCSLPSSSIHGILQVRILEWVKVRVKSLSRVRLFATPWIVAYQAPQSMEIFRKEYWSGLPFQYPGDLPKPGIESKSALQADALPFEPLGNPYVQSTSCEMLGWMKHKLESILLGERSITSDMQMTVPLWQQAKRNSRAS